MDHDYVLLVEKEEMWAKMLMEVLEDNGIVCTSLPVMGIGLSMRVGAQDRLKVFVPGDDLQKATELLQELFSSESVIEQ